MEDARLQPHACLLRSMGPAPGPLGAEDRLTASPRVGSGQRWADASVSASVCTVAALRSWLQLRRQGPDSERLK